MKKSIACLIVVAFLCVAASRPQQWKTFFGSGGSHAFCQFGKASASLHAIQTEGGEAAWLQASTGKHKFPEVCIIAEADGRVKLQVNVVRGNQMTLKSIDLGDAIYVLERLIKEDSND